MYSLYYRDCNVMVNAVNVASDKTVQFFSRPTGLSKLRSGPPATLRKARSCGGLVALWNGRGSSSPPCDNIETHPSFNHPFCQCRYRVSTSSSPFRSLVLGLLPLTNMPSDQEDTRSSPGALPDAPVATTKQPCHSFKCVY